MMIAQKYILKRDGIFFQTSINKGIISLFSAICKRTERFHETNMLSDIKPENICITTAYNNSEHSNYSL